MNVKFFNVIYPGRGYRLLNIGEELLVNDEVSLMTVEGNKNKRYWQKIGERTAGGTINEPVEPGTPRPYGYYRRKIAN